MPDQPLKVLYIFGSDRSGSTILANILGSVEGFTSVGEINLLWDKGLIENRLCSCNENLRSCNFWQEVLDDLGGMDSLDANKIISLRQSFVRQRHAYRYLLPWSNNRRISESENYLLQILADLYKSISNFTGSHVIVDSSKRAAYGFALTDTETLDVYALHLVRDSRAVAYSMQRKKRQLDKTGVDFLTRHGPGKASIWWFYTNYITEMFWHRRADRYLRIRYEDFISDPVVMLKRIGQLLGKDIEVTDIVNGNEANIKLSHMVGGNPSRFEIGRVALRLDDEWKQSMRWQERYLVSLFTWPLLWRYGYIGRRY